MRALVYVCALALVLPGGYWLGAAQLLPGWLNAEIARQPDLDGRVQPVTGFPARFDLVLDNPAWRSAESDLEWRSALVTASIPSFAPNRLRLDLSAPHDVVFGRVALQMDSARFDGDIALGLDLALADAGISLADMRLTPALAVHTLAGLDMRLTAQEGARYGLALEGRDLHLAPAFLASFGPEADLPDILSAFGLDAVLAFERPLAVTAPLPVLRQIDLARATLVWGDIQLGLSGQVRRNESGDLDGDLTVVARNWQPLLRALVAAGVLAPDIAGYVGMFLTGQADPVTGEVALPLLLRRSVLSLGPFALLEVPRF
jgi:hypothetical protein